MTLDQTERSCKLFVIFARNAPTAIVFRRSSDNSCQLIRWNLQNDSFEFGEWYHGTIFVRRSDLSPDGTKLLYFAGKALDTAYDTAYTAAWTAVSKVPWVKPIVLWPKGDKVAGGGLFHSDNHIWLNHRAHQAKYHPHHMAPDSVSFNTNQWATGDDYPIFANHLERDGWRYKQHGDFRLRKGVWVAETEEICTKLDPTRRYEIEMTLYAFEKRTTQNILQYRFSIRDLVSGHSLSLDCDDWADWDSRGRLAYSKGDRLFAGGVLPTALLDVDVVADFSHVEFTEVAPPEDAATW
jgi:hypothetical protein